MLPAEPVPFINPDNILKLTDDEIDAMLDGIRERRLRALRIYQEKEEEKEQKAYDKAAESLDNQRRLLAGNIDRVAKALEAMEKRINKVRALRLQMGIPIE